MHKAIIIFAALAFSLMTTPLSAQEEEQLTFTNYLHAGGISTTDRDFDAELVNNQGEPINLNGLETSFSSDQELYFSFGAETAYNIQPRYQIRGGLGVAYHSFQDHFDFRLDQPVGEANFTFFSPRETDYDTWNLEIPLTFRLNIYEGFYAETGLKTSITLDKSGDIEGQYIIDLPEEDINLSFSESLSSEDLDYLETLDMAAPLTLGYTTEFGIDFGLSYEVGLTETMGHNFNEVNDHLDLSDAAPLGVDIEELLGFEDVLDEAGLSEARFEEDRNVYQHRISIRAVFFF